MAKVRDVEKRIFQVEGFRVRFLHPDGRDVRADRMNVPQYPYKRMMKNNANVTDWIQGRFNVRYPGFKVDVLMKGRVKANGRYHLGTVRDTYL